MRDLTFCIDRGGTFTDCICYQENAGQVWVEKLLSVDPNNYSDAPREGIRRLLERATGHPHPKHLPIDTARISSIRMATTVATNSLLERTGERFALLTSRGFRDLWLIGNQSRPDIFDLSISGRPHPLYEQVIEVHGRVTLLSDDEDEHEGFRIDNLCGVEQGRTGERVAVLEPLDEERLRQDLMQLSAEHGIRNLSVVLMHSFAYPKHERRVREIALELRCFDEITLSSDLMPMIKIVPRGHSACVDAYLTPGIQRYISSFAAGFDTRFADDVEVLFMQSDGGLVPMDQFTGFKAILSGPAGGVVGYARTSFNNNNNQPVIGFDMGGTSTDVSRYDGKYHTVNESETAGVNIQAPHLDISTIAAGGGSRLFYDNGLFKVGPESAGAHPGPACYRKGGPLTITDANLVLGRLLPQYFPRIFGPQENESLDPQASKSLFEQLAIKRQDGQNTMSVEEIAMGFIRVANESMCRPIRAITRSKGFDTKNHLLACFGGAGGQHACAIAKQLGIRTIFIHKYASVLSAYGLGLAAVAVERLEPCSAELSVASMPHLMERLGKMQLECASELKRQRKSSTQSSTSTALRYELYLNLRFQGTDCALMTVGEDFQSWHQAFTESYKREFGFLLTDRPIIVDDLRVRALWPSLLDDNSQADDLSLCADNSSSNVPNAPLEVCQVYFVDAGYLPAAVYQLERLKSGESADGPAIILDRMNTILIEPGWRALITSSGNVAIRWTDMDRTTPSTAVAAATAPSADPIQLSIFSHRFMSIAEQMGYALQRTAVSTNIKERLDFSCALFAPDGGLVANAPHIPVHLGSMQEAVRFQLHNHVDDLRDGNVLVTNHPQAGGSHLPDITVITPVFDGNDLAFFVASRGHHADIGGISPGSMPPHSKYLFEEGAMIKSFPLVRQGTFDEPGITRLLLDEPARFPGCSGTRNLRDNLSDLRAQVAANHKGVQLVRELIGEYGLPVVHAYMFHIRQNAESTVRQLLRNSALTVNGNVLSAEDYMDDGTPVRLRVKINPQDGSAVFDFTGTGPQVFGNINAPPAITYSAVIYALRCMVRSDIPLNQGCLAPVRIDLPRNSILSPADDMAVVGGNVLTSQRVVDVILKAFGAAAASQGCMNNLTFGVPPRKNGRAGWGYYETICGGSGAGPGFHGQSGVHTHMTNTRITDPEILERRYPVILREFTLRSQSGGCGQYHGGDGVVRELQFCVPLQVSILSERRVHRPFGLEGGEAGQSGLNLLLDGRTGVATNLGGKNTVCVSAGDRLRILTPGGGGFGSK